MWPEFSFGAFQHIPTYFPLLSLLYCGLLFWAVKKADHEERDRRFVLDLSLVLMISGFLGGRLFHVFYEAPELYWEHPAKILEFWEGGFVFFGGFLFCLVFGTLFTRYRRQSFLTWADFFTPIFSLGYALGRLTCFFSGCCYGRYCEYPWAITLPWDSQALPRHPTQLYAVFWELAVFVLLLTLQKKRVRLGTLFFTWLVGHALGRILMEAFRDDFRGGFYLGQSISTWISLVILAVGMFFLSRHPMAMASKRKK